MIMQSQAFPRALFGTFLLVSSGINAAETYLDLTSLLNQDAFVSQATGTGSPLDAAGRWLQAATLPAGYLDGTAFATVDGWTRFRYGPLKSVALDALRVEGQSVPVPPGQYGRLHLAWLATDGDMADLSRMLLLNYAD
jgi:hypothetical protein